MNRSRLLLSMLFALVCSGLLTWQIGLHVARKTVPTTSPIHHRVMVAAHDLAAGDVLTVTSVSSALWDGPALPPGLAAAPDALLHRVLLVPVSQGEPLTLHDLRPLNAPQDTSGAIPSGMRAVSLSPADFASDFTCIKPGEHVDIFVTYRPNAQAAPVSSLLLQNITLRAADPQKTAASDPRFSGTPALTVLVTPEQAGRLAAAVATGKVTFALRNDSDAGTEAGLTHVSVATLQATVSAPPSIPTTRAKPRSPVAQPGGYTVETLSGNKLSTQTFSEVQ